MGLTGDPHLGKVNLRSPTTCELLCFPYSASLFAWTLLDTVGQVLPKRAARLLHAPSQQLAVAPSAPGGLARMISMRSPIELRRGVEGACCAPHEGPRIMSPDGLAQLGRAS
jgi:hypothetical protein